MAPWGSLEESHATLLSALGDVACAGAAVPRESLAMSLFAYLREALNLGDEEAAMMVTRDLHRTYGRKTPKGLKAHLPKGWQPPRVARISGGLVRQARHAAV